MKITFSDKEKVITNKISNYLLKNLWIISTILLLGLVSFNLSNDDNNIPEIDSSVKTVKNVDSLKMTLEKINKISMSKEDIEILNLLVYTETVARANSFEYQLVLECILLRYFESGESSIKNYVMENPMVFQGWINRKDYYNAVKGDWVENNRQISCPGCKRRTTLVSSIVKSRINTGSPRPVKYYHRTDLKSVNLNGSNKKINWKHISYVEKQADKKLLVKIESKDLIHNFYELPLDLVPEGYYKWRKNIVI